MKFELENKLEFEKIKLEKAKLVAHLELERISLEKEKIRERSQEVSNSIISISVESEMLGQCRSARKLSENDAQCVPGVSSNKELETSRITNEIRADPLTISEEEMGLRGHCPVDSYTDKFTALVPPYVTTINDEARSQEPDLVTVEGVEKVRGSDFQTEECKTSPRRKIAV
ncbi:hypothetical protein AVEN_208817-1 [Araneus ventricosus]|uniref:Uncharacterized protein n=1 Tax=Araneus ventricosus TaxID=182803 RepID=A0A4Y2HVA0_ARAVE|nr:hypothetical protein AVEN_208817-1 [Araneus ventricosus]